MENTHTKIMKPCEVLQMIMFADARLSEKVKCTIVGVQFLQSHIYFFLHLHSEKKNVNEFVAAGG